MYKQNYNQLNLKIKFYNKILVFIQEYCKINIIKSYYLEIRRKEYNQVH